MMFSLRSLLSPPRLVGICFSLVSSVTSRELSQRKRVLEPEVEHLLTESYYDLSSRARRTLYVKKVMISSLHSYVDFDEVEIGNIGRCIDTALITRRAVRTRNE